MSLLISSRLGRRALRLSLMASLSALFLACQSQNAKVEKPLTETLAAPASQLDFWHELALRPLVSNDEAFHGLLLYVDGEDPALNYRGRMQLMKWKGMLSEGFDRPENEAVTRGTLAMAATRILNIKGGLTMRVFGPSPRYAVREMQYINLFPESATYQTFSGSQFITFVGRIEDKQRYNQDRVTGGGRVQSGSAPGTPPQTQPAGS